MASTRGLTIGRLAAAAGVHLETIRYYERISLMPRPQRTGSGYRSYDVEDVRRLSFIRRARDLGFGIREIEALLALAEPSRVSCADIRALTMGHLAEVRAKIADLHRLEAILARAVDQCSGTSTPACPVVDVLSGD